MNTRSRRRAAHPDSPIQLAKLSPQRRRALSVGEDWFATETEPSTSCCLLHQATLLTRNVTYWLGTSVGG